MLEEESSCEPVTEKEAKKYYDARPDLFESEILFTASHILIKAVSEEDFSLAKIRIETIRSRVEAGEDFIDLVRAESDDSQNDGHLGTFGKGRMVPPFEKAVMALKPDELSKPVRTQFGWHIIKMHERREPKVTPFEEVKDKIIEYLVERKKDSVFEKFLDELKKKAKITEVAGI